MAAGKLPLLFFDFKLPMGLLHVARNIGIQHAFWSRARARQCVRFPRQTRTGRQTAVLSSFQARIDPRRFPIQYTHCSVAMTRFLLSASQWCMHVYPCLPVPPLKKFYFIAFGARLPIEQMTKKVNGVLPLNQAWYTSAEIRQIQILAVFVFFGGFFFFSLSQVRFGQ